MNIIINKRACAHSLFIVTLSWSKSWRDRIQLSPPHMFKCSNVLLLRTIPNFLPFVEVTHSSPLSFSTLARSCTCTRWAFHLSRVTDVYHKVQTCWNKHIMTLMDKLDAITSASGVATNWILELIVFSLDRLWLVKVNYWEQWNVYRHLISHAHNKVVLIQLVWTLSICRNAQHSSVVIQFKRGWGRGANVFSQFY